MPFQISVTFMCFEDRSGFRTGAVVNGAPVALQSRDPASAAAEVESHPVLHAVIKKCLQKRVYIYHVKLLHKKFNVL